MSDRQARRLAWRFPNGARGIEVWTVGDEAEPTFSRDDAVWLIAYLGVFMDWPSPEGTPNCKRCGRVDQFDFRVPDDVWAAVVPEELRTRVVCLSCFDDYAARREIDYSVPELFFAGQRRSHQWTDALTGLGVTAAIEGGPA